MLFVDKDCRATVHGMGKSWTWLSAWARTHMLSAQGLKRCYLPHSDNRRHFSLVSVVGAVMLLIKWFVFPYGHYKSHSRLFPFHVGSQRGSLPQVFWTSWLFILWVKFLPDTTVISNLTYFKYFLLYIYLLSSKVE